MEKHSFQKRKKNTEYKIKQKIQFDIFTQLKLARLQMLTN